ncbi:hypothetical protein BDZ94DRAFT_17999 [Collybia nuda]|uniref:F-box domain-containing protein n=1 Tax=Collybia nuda TaxID=64659 RepID=A0A9P5YGV3_9AGAR|nr:hypothetical protein BDZ94DRAFT_17999 [Collybia nuda]
MSFDNLPVELYSTILLHIPPRFRQQTVLTLSRALPLSPIPLSYLFHSVRISHPDQAVTLNQRLRATNSRQDTQGGESLASLVFEFSLETWKVDADVLINLISLLQNLTSLRLWIGPNFAPEHLEEMFSRYMPNLRHLSLRFRPYVQKATYFQFLKGAYFDSTLAAISAWPPSSHELPTLSIVQDPFLPDPSQIKQRFAQPIVFFRLDPVLSHLVHSPLSCGSLKYLRIRVPARAIVQALITHLNPRPDLGSSMPPLIELLDASTCSILDTDIDTLLVTFKKLKHLILDRCVNLLRGGTGPGMGQELEWWSALGKRCALVGVRRAREKEKEIKAWFETQIRNSASTENDNTNTGTAANNRRPKRGRKGLATATMSLRAPTPSIMPGSLSNAGKARIATQPKLSVPPKIQIIPPLPSLLSLSLSPTIIAHPTSPEIRDLVTTEFEKGWRDGMRVLWEKRGRLGASIARNMNGSTKTRFLKFKEEDCEDVADDFEGLEEIGPDDLKILSEPVNENGFPRLTDIPILCIGGPGQDGGIHRDSCGHSVSQGIWADEP